MLAWMGMKNYITAEVATVVSPSGEEKRVYNYFFFNDVSIKQTAKAFEAAAQVVSGDLSKLAFFQPPVHAGPWDRAGIIGHRRRSAILADIVGEEDPEELDHRRQELERLDATYHAVGREKTPVDLVAA